MGSAGTRKPRLWAILGCLVMVAAGCGNRLSYDKIVAENTVGQSAGSSAAGTSGEADQATSNGGVGTDGGSTAQAGASGGTGGDQASAAQSGQGSGGSAARAGSGATATKAPIVIGFVGWLSGLGGPTIEPVRDAWIAWQKMVNARGGLNGHPVQLLVGDDGGNESRSLSVVRDFVENKGAIAISWAGGSTVASVANYAKSKSVPIIGTALTEATWNENPMLFPPYTSAPGHRWGIARGLKMAGIKKVAVIYCVESAVCKSGSDLFKAGAKVEGLDVVYEGTMSMTQPDYTAECLQMRNAGAEAVYPITENTSLVRMAQSCSRQGYKPTWALGVAADSMAKVPELEGAVVMNQGFSWFLRTGSPAVEEYAAALQKYAPNRLTDGVDSQTWGWMAAKVFEKAAANVSDRPTSQDILNGLWSMKGETLGGLATGRAARTYTRGQPTPENYCVYGARIKDGKFVALQGTNPVCR